MKSSTLLAFRTTDPMINRLKNWFFHMPPTHTWKYEDPWMMKCTACGYRIQEDCRSRIHYEWIPASLKHYDDFDNDGHPTCTDRVMENVLE